MGGAYYSQLWSPIIGKHRNEQEPKMKRKWKLEKKCNFFAFGYHKSRFDIARLMRPYRHCGARLRSTGVLHVLNVHGAAACA